MKISVNKKWAYLFFFFSFFLFVVSLFNYFSGQQILQRSELYTTVIVTSSHAGFDLNTTALTFGRLPQEGTITRNIFIDNNFPFSVVANIICTGDICELLHFDSSEIIKKGEHKQISFTVGSSEKTVQKIYVGRIVIELRRKTTIF